MPIYSIGKRTSIKYRGEKGDNNSNNCMQTKTGKMLNCWSISLYSVNSPKYTKGSACFFLSCKLSGVIVQIHSLVPVSFSLYLYSVLYIFLKFYFIFLLFRELQLLPIAYKRVIQRERSVGLVIYSCTRAS